MNYRVVLHGSSLEAIQPVSSGARPILRFRPNQGNQLTACQASPPKRLQIALEGLTTRTGAKHVNHFARSFISGANWRRLVGEYELV